MTFAETFAIVRSFDGALAVSKDAYTKEQAAELFADYQGAPVEVVKLGIEESDVRFGFCIDDDGYRQNGWTYPAWGKGAKPVWIYE